MTSTSSAPSQGPSSDATRGRTARYIVRARLDDGALAAFIASLGAQPAIRLVDTVGPKDAPHTAVVETDPDTAEQLRCRNLNQLTIEPDQPLSLFD